MSKLDQMRRGIGKLIAADSGVGTITRSVTVPGDRPGQQPVITEETNAHKIICRVSYQSGSVWPGKQWEGGLTIDASPYVLAAHDADLKQYDVLDWRGKKYSVGVVTRPDFGCTCTQAPLTEVSE